MEGKHIKIRGDIMKMKRIFLISMLLVFVLMVVGCSSDVEPVYDDPTEEEQQVCAPTPATMPTPAPTPIQTPTPSPTPNNIEQSNYNAVVIYEGRVFVSLQSILESIGSTITHDKNTGNIYFDYAGEEYVAAFRAPGSARYNRYTRIFISTVENYGSIRNLDYIQLNPMAADGTFRIINGNVYVWQLTGERLLDAFGYELIIDAELIRMSVYS